MWSCPSRRAVWARFEEYRFDFGPSLVRRESAQRQAVVTAKPGNEIQSPMGIVILGGLLSSTFLNLIVVPALFVSWGRREPGT